MAQPDDYRGAFAPHRPARPPRKPMSGCAAIALCIGVGVVGVTIFGKGGGQGAPAVPPMALAQVQERFAACSAIIDRLKSQDLLVQTDANRIEIDDRQWAELMAQEKRNIAAGWACVVFRGRPLHELAVMDFAVVYGRRSGHRLAMAGSTGVNLE